MVRPMRRYASLLLLTATAFAGRTVAQETSPPPQSGKTAVSLPGETGKVHVVPSWIVLTAADLLLASRPSDPAADPARGLVAGIAAELKQRERTRDNLVLHQPGMAAGQVRVINAYSQPAEVTSAQLLDRDRVDELRRNFETSYTQQDGVNLVRLSDDQTAKLFAIDALALRWRIERADASGTATPQWILEVHAVPADDRLQFFEVFYHPDDMDGRSAIEAVLQTFDGAAEPADDSTLRGMLVGGIAGAVAGMLVALMRKRRMLRAQQQRIQVEDA